MISPSLRIEALPPHLVNQIAAGEVIERPASVIKELIENSIDAGAVHISVMLSQGGKQLIRITDDGFGIQPEDLPLALASHATSKLRTSDDLHSILTLGFRGEALASIASVSELDLRSRPPGADVGHGLEARDGGIREGRPEPMPPGTRVTVRNLFYNVPARKRFLRTDRAELTRTTTTVKQLALAHPHVGFDVSHEDRTVFRYPSGQCAGDRLREIVGSETFNRLLPLPDSHPRLRGWVGRPDDVRRDTNSIQVFLNGRFVRDRVVLHAVKAAYHGFQIPGHHPIAVLFLNLEPGEVDVNVHPAKLEVRFTNSSRIHSFVSGTVREVLEAAGSVPTLFPRELAGGVPATSRMADRWAERTPVYRTNIGEPNPVHPTPPPEEVHEVVAAAVPLLGGREVRVFQVKNSYLVVEEEEGLTVIDQHALHEKILYEEICRSRSQTKSGALRQALLVPETVELDPEEWETFIEARSALADLGFEVEEFGDRTVVVRSHPAGFEEAVLPTLLRDVLRQLQSARELGTEVNLSERLVATLACRRAVKAGQPLLRPALLDLLRGRDLAFQPQNCPHGRPAELFISWRELERRFDRK